MHHQDQRKHGRSFVCQTDAGEGPGLLPAERARQAPYPLEGTPDADVSELKVVNTYSPVWCTGATAGSRMMSVMVPRTCHTTEAAFQSARKRVGRKLISACSSRMTARHAAVCQTCNSLRNHRSSSDRAHTGLPGAAQDRQDLLAPRA